MSNFSFAFKRKRFNIDDNYIVYSLYVRSGRPGAKIEIKYDDDSIEYNTPLWTLRRAFPI